MIQLIALRSFTDKQTGKLTGYDKIVGYAESVPEVIANPDKYLSDISESERFNLFYTVADCGDGKREFVSQSILPLDIDGIDRDRIDEYAPVVCMALGIELDDVGVVYSGNGIHILIGLNTPFTDVTYFDAHREHYKALCGKINYALYDHALRGTADTTAFCRGRILRMPNTLNVKKDKPTTKCRVKNGTIKNLPLSLTDLSELPSVVEGEHIHPKAYARFPDPDVRAIEDGCSFLKHCKENPGAVTEPEWYAMLSIVGRFPNGEDRAQEYSKGHPDYDPIETELKRVQSLNTAGPRTCENISLYHAGCANCPHFRKIKSPIQITDKETIRTKSTGFYNIVVKNGIACLGKPNYDDLLKHFQAQYDHVTVESSHQTFIYKGTHWEEMSSLFAHSFAEQSFDPKPTNSMCNEFEGKLKRNNLVPQDFMRVHDMLNFSNGILDLGTREIIPHSKEYGFTYVIPYEYKPTGRQPEVFIKFIQQVTCGDEDLERLLCEYLGYCLSGCDSSVVQQCMILYGEGSNGKSVLLKLMQELVGDSNCSAVSMSGLAKETNRYQLMHKMFNVSHESPTKSFVESDAFKALVGGDVIEVRRLYHQPVFWKCTTKFIFACNSLPATDDYSHGMFRRLLLVPFKATFSKELGNLDPLILNKLLDERCEIFQYLLGFYNEFRKRGYVFHTSKSSQEELEKYKNEWDSVSRFIDTMCEEGETSSRLDMIYRCYVSWCRDNNTYPCAYGKFSSRFGHTVSKLFPHVSRVRERSGTKKVTVYEGLCISASNF